MDNITKLFQEKVALESQLEPEIPKTKKVKKKDIILPSLQDRELQFQEYEEVNGIKIYNGVIKDERQQLLNDIAFYKLIAKPNIFTEIKASTLTAQGGLTNISFNEEELMQKISNPFTAEFMSIIKIGSNYGEFINYPNPFYEHNTASIINSIINANKINNPDEVKNYIKIGCACSNLNDKIELLSNNIKYIEDNKLFLYEAVQKFQKDVWDNKVFKKKKAMKMAKDFNIIMNYIPLPDEDITDLKATLSFDEDNKDSYIIFLDKIVETLKIIQAQAINCKCPKLDVRAIKDTFKLKNTVGKRRGRKVNVEKKKIKRKVHGTGAYFSSQITFDIYDQGKIYKIKLFRNGNFQVPGIKDPKMHDLVTPIDILCKFINAHPGFLTDNVSTKDYLVSAMRNYTCKLANKNLMILLHKLEDLFKYEKTLPTTDISLFSVYQVLKEMDKDTCLVVSKYFNRKFYLISEIMNNCERYPGIVIKFHKPKPYKLNKKITIKVLPSGKINFDGVNSELEVHELYYWLQYIFGKYWNEITYDSDIKKNDISSDSEDYLSIYSD